MNTHILFETLKLLKEYQQKHCLQETHDYSVTSCMLIFSVQEPPVYLPKASLAFIDQLEGLGLAFCKEHGKYLLTTAPYLQQYIIFVSFSGPRKNLLPAGL